MPKSVFDMTDQEIVDNYEELLISFLRPTTSRVVGMVTIHMNIKVVRRIIEAETRVGKYGGRIEDTAFPGPRHFYWKDVGFAPGISYDYSVAGFIYGVNTWIGKIGWWKFATNRAPTIQTILRPRG